MMATMKNEDSKDMRILLLLTSKDKGKTITIITTTH